MSRNQVRIFLTDKWCVFKISWVSFWLERTLQDWDVLKTGVYSVQVYTWSGWGWSNLCQQSWDGSVQLCQVPVVLVRVKNVLLISTLTRVSWLAVEDLLDVSQNWKNCFSEEKMYLQFRLWWKVQGPWFDRKQTKFILNQTLKYKVHSSTLT